ncbi:MAG: hypothetical protein QOJ75_2206 [Chloroflexota bacterium]|jgi:plastocyanin|nr:hypothetical protein [Chloroflexota bacterium]
MNVAPSYHSPMAEQARSQRGTGRIPAGLLAAIVAGLLLLAAGSVQAATITVAAVNYEYKPASRTIAVGDVVRWTVSGDPHSATSDTGLFDSGVLNPGGSFQFRFTAAGTYHYHCLVHPEQMFGVIVVKAAATAKPTVRPTPRPTVQPTARPTPRQTPSPPPTPTAPPTSTPSPAEAATPSAVPSTSEAASEALVESAVPSNAAASPGPGAPTPTSASDPTPIVVVVVVLGIVAGAGLLFARRRRVT